MKRLTLSFPTIILITIYVIHIRAQKPEPSAWAETKPHGHERKTLLQFYFHDVVKGESPTDAVIAQPIQANGSSSVFGQLVMADVPLTVGPDPKSKLVGRAQGLMGMSSKEELSVMMSLSYSFVDGAYNWSSVVILGQNPIMHQVKELPIVGGTGLFRLARGYALAQIYSANVTTFNAIVGYNVTIFHL